MKKTHGFVAEGLRKGPEGERRDDSDRLIGSHGPAINATFVPNSYLVRASLTSIKPLLSKLSNPISGLIFCRGGMSALLSTRGGKYKMIYDDYFTRAVMFHDPRKSVQMHANLKPPRLQGKPSLPTLPSPQIPFDSEAGRGFVREAACHFGQTFSAPTVPFRMAYIHKALRANMEIEDRMYVEPPFVNMEFTAPWQKIAKDRRKLNRPRRLKFEPPVMKVMNVVDVEIAENCEPHTFGLTWSSEMSC
ncbi:hypothetical protein B0H11DRAFT_2193480 [Mycena galericulata]|nr:hypothetical protein B0H11DRAFT_2193480 [Mycena galericulata]